MRKNKKELVKKISRGILGVNKKRSDPHLKNKKTREDHAVTKSSKNRKKLIPQKKEKNKAKPTKPLSTPPLISKKQINKNKRNQVTNNKTIAVSNKNKVKAKDKTNKKHNRVISISVISLPVIAPIKKQKTIEKEQNKSNSKKEIDLIEKKHSRNILTQKEIEIRQYVREAKRDDQRAYEYLLKMMEPDIKKIHGKYKWWVKGYDNDDIYNECAIMLMKAIEKFDFRPNVSFRYFAFVFFRRRISSLIEESKRQKHKTLNNSSSIDESFFDDDGNECDQHQKICTDEELISKKVENKQYLLYIKKLFFSHLTPMEKDVFELYLDNLSYDEISDKLKIENKSVDNAIQRAKNKMEKFKEDMKEELDTINYDPNNNIKHKNNGDNKI